MAKEKMSELESKNREYIFIYEILGVICIIVSLISLTRLGIVGKYGMLTFRLLFGDWYFLFLILLGMMGVYFLFAHRRFELSNIRYLGILIILISLIILTHFSMHEFVSQYEDNELKLCILLYLDYFKNGRSEMMVGGGILGSLFFYLFYYLFSSVGIILICGILIFVGIVFMTKKTVFEFVIMIKNWFSRWFGGAFSLSKKMKGKFHKFNEGYTHNKTSKVINSKYLNNDKVDFSNLNIKAVEYTEDIKKILNHLNIFYQSVNYMVCNHITVYFIVTYQDINYEVLKISLKKYIIEPFLVRSDVKNHSVIIEVNNIEGHILSMKEGVVELNKGNMRMILGKDDRNMMIDTEDNILIIGENNNYYKSYFLSLMMLPMFHHHYYDYEIIVIDLNKNFELIKDKINNYYDNISCISELKTKLDDLLYNLDESKSNNIEEYNRNKRKKIKKPLIYISGLEHIVNSYEYLHDYEYYIMSGTNIGYCFICSVNDNIVEEQMILKNFEYKIILYNKFMITDKLIGYGIVNNINHKIEGLVKYRDVCIRMSLLMIRRSEIEKISKRY